MGYKISHLEKAVNLKGFFKSLEGNISDMILLIATFGDESDCFKNIDFGPYTNDIVEGPEPGECFVAIIDVSEKKSIWKCGKELSVDYEWGGCKFGVSIRGSAGGSDDVFAYFKIDRNEIRPEDEGRLKILLFSKSENQIVNLLSLDTNATPILIVENADVDVFNLERRLYLSGLDDIIHHSSGEEKDISKTSNFIRRVSYHFSELLNNPERLAPYAKARLASFYADRNFLDPNYPAALKQINSAIDSSNINDDDLTDSTSVYYAVNQFLSKRDLPDTLSEKEAYFMNMSPAGGRLRLLQISAVILLKLFDNICKKHNLQYWVIAGTRWKSVV